MSNALDTDTYKMSLNISKQEQYNTKSSQFGDGYRQIIIDGINYEKETWNILFIPMDITIATTLENLLLESVNGTTNYLSWTPPGDPATKYWTAGSVSKSLVEKFWQVGCILTREFPLTV